MGERENRKEVNVIFSFSPLLKLTLRRVKIVFDTPLFSVSASLVKWALWAEATSHLMTSLSAISEWSFAIISLGRLGEDGAGLLASIFRVQGSLLHKKKRSFLTDCFTVCIHAQPLRITGYLTYGLVVTLVLSARVFFSS